MLSNGDTTPTTCRFVAILLFAAVAVAVPVPAAAQPTAQPTGVVNVPGLPLNIRAAPTRDSRRVGTLRNGTLVAPVCQVVGQVGTGSERRTNLWDKLPNGGYVHDGYIRHRATFPSCTDAGRGPEIAAATRRAHWTHPLPGFPVQGGFRTVLRPNHQGVDIMAFRGTPVRAAADGVVLEIVCDIQPGGSCDLPGTPTSRGCGWFVKIGHAGNVATLYCHLLRRPQVKPGTRVRAGDPIGLVGSSGRSSFPHLHFEIHLNSPPTHPWNATDPMAFMTAVGSALPKA